MPKFFIVATYMSHYEASRKAWPGARLNDTWTITNDRYWMAGYVAVFTDENTARVRYADRIRSNDHETSHSLVVVRAWTKKRAAEKMLAGRGKLVEQRAWSAAEKESIREAAAEEANERLISAIATYRDLLDATLAQHEHLADRAAVKSYPAAPNRERIELRRAVIGLYRCGAIAEARMAELQDALESSEPDFRTDDSYLDLPPVEARPRIVRNPRARSSRDSAGERRRSA